MLSENILKNYYLLNEFSKLFDAALQAHGRKLRCWMLMRAFHSEHMRHRKFLYIAYHATCSFCTR